MVDKADIKQSGKYLFEIPKSHRGDMRVPANFYTASHLLSGFWEDGSLKQLINTASLPGVVEKVLAMPDIHQGYGFPIGGVVATDAEKGVISPGGVGYDINCGVRLLGTRIDEEEIDPHIDTLLSALYANCPSGMGRGGNVRLNPKALDRVLETGARWALKNGYASEEDLARTEGGGCLEGADADKVSPRAKDRGKNQMGTLGSGNHFIEIDIVQRLFDATAARQMGLFEGQVVVQIHCGSRGLGHQVCGDYVKRFHKSVRQYGFRLPDRELVCAPLTSSEGQDYLAAMNAAANYAFANRQVLTHHIRRSFEQVLAGKLPRHHVYQVYDVAHNIAKIETHRLASGQKLKVCVHRKGATRAFGPGSPALPEVYQGIGQPVLVPGSMGTASWVLVGTEKAMTETFGSCCHGAGRTISRKQAKKRVRGGQLREDLTAKGIHVRSGSLSGLAEEAPIAYKDVDAVVNVMHGAGIAKKVARLVPIGVIKG